MRARKGRMQIGRLIFAVCVAGLAAAPAEAEDAAWPGDFLGRVEALAVVESLNAELLAARSATLTLEKWCGTHRLAGDGTAKIVAHLIRGQDKPATPEQRERLQVGPQEKLNYRRVELLCGERVLSVADNWYVPSRLTAEMNHTLETTDTPFGKAVLDLHFYRQNFAAEMLWRPLEEGWETKPVPAAPPARLWRSRTPSSSTVLCSILASASPSPRSTRSIRASSSPSRRRIRNGRARPRLNPPSRRV
jgi:chorismate-pyruvate lyase